MIFKSDLIDAINSLSHDLVALSVRVSDLEREVGSIRIKKVKVSVKTPTKRSPGRPRKNTQPRDKSGKFAKK